MISAYLIMFVKQVMYMYFFNNKFLYDHKWTLSVFLKYK